jgi:hypothetical protein
LQPAWEKSDVQRLMMLAFVEVAPGRWVRYLGRVVTAAFTDWRKALMVTQKKSHHTGS